MKRYCLWVKCLAFVLSVILLLGVAVGALSVFVSESLEMYNQENFESWISHRLRGMSEEISYSNLHEYLIQSDCPQWLLEQTGYDSDLDRLERWYEITQDEWYCVILDPSGKEVYTKGNPGLEAPLEYTFSQQIHYPRILERRPVQEAVKETDPSVPADARTESVSAAATDVTMPTVAHDYDYYEIYIDPQTVEEVCVTYVESEIYETRVAVSRTYSSYYCTEGLPQTVLREIFALRYVFIAVAGVCLLLFALVLIFLLSIAGKDPRTGQADPKALNRLPLDLYLAAAAVITVLGCVVAYELLDMLFYSDSYNVIMLALLCGCGILVATTVIGFFTAVAAQFKVPGHFWWKHSLCGNVLKWLWKGIRFCWRCAVRLVSLLPVIWQWLLVGFGLGFGLFVIMLIGYEINVWLITLWWCAVGMAVICYGGWCFGTIIQGIKRMKEGELREKIDTGYMLGAFKSMGEDLNTLADVAAVAAEKQLRSERMKTELITNVSHDIKTPLTSVINYVDLLRQPHSEEEGEQYLEVLSRQSQRLKKLVEDLMDMSKASSGNIQVELTSVDAVEAVNQALGEFADKLENARLTPVFRAPDSQLHMLADGKLTWRVLSNLLSNVVKYAMPGTRVYLDLLRLDRVVVLSVKNISREELNISAQELAERFVRGDVSRNTEGSGLGLNIAQSLMRLQGGSMDILVDGDLFKVTLTFPTE